MIETSVTIEFSLEEICERADLPSEALITIVEEGLLAPSGASPVEWCFDIQMLTIAKRAARLHKDFDIEWPSIPLFIDMIEQMEKLRTENQQLRQQLLRFIEKD